MASGTLPPMTPQPPSPYRTHLAAGCGPDLAGQPVLLAGWLHRRRDLGGVCFCELRDASGFIQLVASPDTAPEAFASLTHLREESVLSVTGIVQPRPAGQENPDWSSGGIEVHCTAVRVLNEADVLPILVNADGGESQERLFTWRYLHLRRPAMRQNLLLRHAVMQATREFFFAQGFHELETPILCKGTPEGSREYLVPYRQEPGMFYVLPQSPQQFKQLLVTAGFEKYFQIARCFRDEDLRSNRQPEFTQLDLEWAFPTQEEILETIEEWICTLWQAFLGLALPRPFPRMPYAEAMARYGVDKPDCRFGNELIDLGPVFAASEIRFLRGALEAGGQVLGLPLPGVALSRSEAGQWEERAKSLGAAGLAWVVREAEGWRGSVAKNLSAGEQAALAEQVPEGGSLLILGQWGPGGAAILGALRTEAAAQYGWIPPGTYAPLFIVDFPLFEQTSDGGITAVHHPFTMPHLAQWAALKATLGHEPTLADGAPLLALGSQTHDLVINGEEIGSGSIRIHEPALQQQIFRCLGIPDETIQARFGHMLEAFRYGAPPHGGMAPGMDRLIAMLAGEEAITAVIPFPKTLKGHDLLMGAPAPMPEATLREVGIQVLKP